jgi:hypothetical protein
MFFTDSNAVVSAHNKTKSILQFTQVISFEAYDGPIRFGGSVDLIFEPGVTWSLDQNNNNNSFSSKFNLTYESSNL